MIKTWKKVDFYKEQTYIGSIDMCIEDYIRIKTNRPNFHLGMFISAYFLNYEEVYLGLITWNFDSSVEPYIVDTKIDLIK
ncbi:hypothetical protein [Cetobacterium sp.]|uniref:hypothetical protein n=1 Tax=Cetobacterium sp. TaxID=2071632 RepID=UPI003EE56EA0